MKIYTYQILTIESLIFMIFEQLRFNILHLLIIIFLQLIFHKLYESFVAFQKDSTYYYIIGQVSLYLFIANSLYTLMIGINFINSFTLVKETISINP
jgi:hypothetical protein